MLLLAAISAWWLARFPISRAQHEARLELLANRRAAALRQAVAGQDDAA
jgi:glycoside/pentoside/hexuronide:cation symporter, GPH family